MSLLTLLVYLSLAKCIKQTLFPSLFQARIKSCYDIKKTCRWIDGFKYEFDRNCLSTVFDKYSQIYLEGGLKSRCHLVALLKGPDRPVLKMKL